MDKQELPKTPKEWEHFIRKAFNEAWNERSTVDVSNYLYRIEDQFYLNRISEQLVIYSTRAPYYERAINSLAALLCDALLEYSDDGKQLTAHHIHQAKEQVKAAIACPEIEI
jgi:hypothetical protein